jgi:hypothetical protein
MFGYKHREYASLLEMDNQSEIDIDQTAISLYHSIIGAMPTLGGNNVDALAIAAQGASSITKAFDDQRQFKIKGTLTFQYILGCNYFKDNSSSLCIVTRKYIKEMIKQ